MFLDKACSNQNEHDLSRYGYNEDTLEKILLNEAEQIYIKLIDNIANKCINEIPNDTKSSSQRLSVPDIQLGLYTDEGHHTDFDAYEGDLFPINLVYNSFALQIHHGLTITNERSSGTVLKNNESDT